MKRIAPLSIMLAGLATATTAHASSHREAQDILNRPCADNTDFYAFTSDNHEVLNLIVVLNGLHEPGQGNQQTRLCNDMAYDINIAKGVDNLVPDIQYRFTFSSSAPSPADNDTPLGGDELLVQLGGVFQTYSVVEATRPDGMNGPITVTELGTGLTVAPPNIGPRTDRLAYAPLYGLPIPDPDPGADVNLYDTAFMNSFVQDLPDGVQSWVGHAEDPYFLDEKAIFDILNLQGAPFTAGDGQPDDVFAGFNSNVIALAVPTERILGGPIPHDGTAGDDTMIALWTTVNERTFKFQIGGVVGDKTQGAHEIGLGPWVQVSRQGLPLVNAALNGVKDQNDYLRTAPADDVTNFGANFLNPVLVRDLEDLGIYAALGIDPTPLLTNRTDILDVISLAPAHNVTAIGDVLRHDLALDTGFPNGRRLETDVSDIIIGLVALGDPAAGVGDNVDANDVPFTNTAFPWVNPAFPGMFGPHRAD